MFYLIYVSSAVKLMNHDELLLLLDEARKKNQELGVTGMLLYQEGTFMQMLEGEKQIVLDLYEAIKKDDRHTGVLTMLTDEIAERNFKDWSMGFFNMDETGEFPNYKDYINENITLKSFHADSHDAYDFMLIFNKINR